MLNYKHLYYMREVANAGSIARASERLYLTPQTISAQISLLEEYFSTPLFQRQGRSLALTEAGEIALRYADEIFQLGEQLEQTLQHYPKGEARLFRVGVSDLVPKSIAYELLKPALSLSKSIRISCTEGKLSDLLADLSVHRLELVLADRPMPVNTHVKGFNHELGSSSVSFFATSTLKAQLNHTFPDCLDGAPLLLPSEGAAVRIRLMRWFSEIKVNPMIVGEFDDSALMKAFGREGIGIFIAPSVLSANLVTDNKVILLGEVPTLKERYYGISIERRITQPAIKAITTHAQDWLKPSA